MYWLSNFHLVFFIQLGLLNLVLAQNPNDKLVFLQAVWRHGDRNPTGTYRMDPYQEDTWPQGWGQLTTRGMTEHVVLGGRLRKHYIDEMKFLNASYHRDEIYVRSTDVDRTLISAISNLIGFYGQSPRVDIDYPSVSGWPGNYQPIPVHTVDDLTDNIANPDAECPRQLAVIRAMNQTPEFAEVMKNRTELFQSLSNLTGEKIVSPIDIDFYPFWTLHDALYIEQLYGKKMPDWLTPAMWKQIDYLHDFTDDWLAGIGLSPVNGLNFSLEMPRMRGGSLLWDFIHNMRAKVHCFNETASATDQSGISLRCRKLNKLKYHIYSAHDSTIGALFSTFHFNKSNFDEEGWPQYTACVTIELWSNASASFVESGYDAYYVKALYWKPNTTDARDITRSIIGCELGCTLKQFAERSEIYKPTPSIDEYCANLELFEKSAAAASNRGMILILVMAFVALVANKLIHATFT